MTFLGLITMWRRKWDGTASLFCRREEEKIYLTLTLLTPFPILPLEFLSKYFRGRLDELMTYYVHSVNSSISVIEICIPCRIWFNFNKVGKGTIFISFLFGIENQEFVIVHHI